MRRRLFTWVALLVVGLAGVVAVSAAAGLAARSTSSQFELVAIDLYEGDCPDCPDATHHGTFTSNAPFCESGTADFGAEPRLDETVRRYTCTDGSGSLTLAERVIANLPFVGGEWMIVEASGRFAGLHGKGRWLSEQLSDQPGFVYRTTMSGVADYDSVAPSVTITSAGATKVSRLAGTYSIRIALSLRDDVEGNPVTYKLSVREGPKGDLDSAEGTTASGSVSTTLRIWPSSKRVRNVVLLLSASDPVGNEVSLVQSLPLPR